MRDPRTWGRVDGFPFGPGRAVGLWVCALHTCQPHLKGVVGSGVGVNNGCGEQGGRGGDA